MFGIYGLTFLESEVLMGRGFRRYGNFVSRRLRMCPPGCIGVCCTGIYCAPGCVCGFCSNPPFMMNQDYIVNNYGQLVPVSTLNKNDPNLFQEKKAEKVEEKEQELVFDKQINPQGKEEQIVDAEVLFAKAEEIQLENFAIKKDKPQKKNQQTKRKETNKLNNSNIQQKLHTYVEVGITRNPNQKDQQILLQGDIWKNIKGQWIPVENALLTSQSFMNINIFDITKLKIKAECQVSGTRVLKICTRNREEHFFSVRAEDQADWMMKIVWAKLNSMGIRCKIMDQFRGKVQSPILRKTFFGYWQPNYGKVQDQTLKLSLGPNTPTTKTVSKVPQIWTRFQIANANMIIIKMHTPSKLQIAVPISKGLSWLKGLYSIINLE